MIPLVKGTQYLCIVVLVEDYNNKENDDIPPTCQLKMFGLNGGWDFKFSSVSVWTHKTLLELELFVHSWGPAWTHKAHYKTSLV